MKGTVPNGQGPHRDRLTVRIGRRLLRSRLLMSLIKRAAGSPSSLAEHDRVALQFQLDLIKSAYPGSGDRVVWANAFIPSELIWALGLVPFYPEIASAIGASLGLSSKSLARATEAHYPVDLCTYHRNTVGLMQMGLYPGAGAFACTSNLCDVAGQVFANLAHQEGKPFFLVDVPMSDDEESVAYVETQLREWIDQLTAATGVDFDPDRLREAICLSNSAWDYAQEVNDLRATRPSPLRGSAMMNRLGVMPCIFGCPDGEAYYLALRDYTRKLISQGLSEQPHQRVRLYWMHLKPYYHTDFLAYLEDELGAVITFEEYSTIWWERLDEDRPLSSLARKILSHPSNGTLERRIAKVLEDVEKFKVDGVVHFNHWGCRQSTGGVRVIRDRLKGAGIPFLQIDGDCIDAANLQLGPIRTRIEAFLEMLT